ncbi:TonB-dependent receptor domain-containing protein [Alkalilimnicola ehrlichii]|uniref:TonB-dependent receptor domain-containing protein n=1 Tax=Alkalilimnicola ehrlichii TaxID=351052 RepID=UPI001C6E8C1F|nr:TonB-dependent receptor [Alkalilimnicola ehrlichii]
MGVQQSMQDGGKRSETGTNKYSFVPVKTLLLLAAAGGPGLAVAESGSEAYLSPLVVTAGGFEQVIENAPASITVITREELQERRVGSVAEALQDVEGIDVGAPLGKTGGMDIRMRGMPSDYTLILIDGRRQNSAGDVTPNGFGETQTSFMPPVSAIERIEVVRGPMSTLYGSDAMGGVINIITRKVSPEWTGTLDLDKTIQQDSQFGDSSTASIYATGPLLEDRLGLQLRGRMFNRSASQVTYREDDGTEAQPSMGHNPVSARNYSLGGRLTFVPNQANELWLDVERSRQSYDNSDGQLGRLGSGGYATKQRFNRDQIAIGHTGRYRLGELESSLMQNTTETIGRTIPPETPGAEDGAPRILETENLVFDTKLVAPVGERHMFTVGGQWWQAEMEEGVADDRFEQTQWALFAENEWYLLNNLALTLGARYDEHDAFGSHLSPRAYLVWNTTDTLTLKGGVSQGYKTPNLEQLHDGIYGFGAQGHLPFLGNPDLKPETSTSTEIGAQYNNRRGFSAA